jgi:hypothetical protein
VWERGVPDREGKSEKKKYASGGQQLVGTATSTGDAREVEEVVGIILIIQLEMAYDCRFKYC